MSSHSSPSPFLSLPPELRNKIYHDLFRQASTLTLRSLFIRTHYRNTFMTQQPKSSLSHIISILRVCRSIALEGLPILYSLPRWSCPCRIEALATQIGTRNFSRITRMVVDVDDLDFLVESLQRARQRSVHRFSTGGVAYAMQMCPVPVPAALGLDDGVAVRRGSVTVTGSRNLDFANLEVLEVEGFQAVALSRRGTHRVRVEALRLCELAIGLLGVHPKLAWLLQRDVGGGVGGGADARDLSLGRVRWRFVKDLPVEIRERERQREEGMGKETRRQRVDADMEVEGEGWLGDAQSVAIGVDEEHIVDLTVIRSALELLLCEDERMAEASQPVAWTSSNSGRFNLYPFLQQV